MVKILEYEAELDKRKRLVIREAEFQHYHVSKYEDGTVVLEPRVLTAPSMISRRTLLDMDETMTAFGEGRAGPPIDPGDLVRHR
jgi:hypothetical protein